MAFLTSIGRRSQLYPSFITSATTFMVCHAPTFYEVIIWPLSATDRHIGPSFKCDLNKLFLAHVQAAKFRFMWMLKMGAAGSCARIVGFFVYGSSVALRHLTSV